jgi:hypothetical protein
MGGAVSSFVGNVAKTVAKTATTALGNMVPVVGPALAGAINSAYKNGGQVTALEMGGAVPEGFKAKVIDTPKQLMTLVKQFPTEAKKAGLSLGIIKDAVENIPAEMMKRGGRKKKAVRQKQKQTQNVKVNVRVGDTVMLRPDSQKRMAQPRPTYGEPIRLAGPGFTFANAPAVSQPSSYGIAPTAVRPMMDRPLQSSADPSKDFNRNKADDVLQAVNPSGIKPGVNEFRAVPSGKSASQGDAENALPAVSSSSLFEGRPVGPTQGGVPEVRAISSNLRQTIIPFARPGGEPSMPTPSEASSSSRRKATGQSSKISDYFTSPFQEYYTPEAIPAIAEDAEQQRIVRELGRKARGGRISVF